MKHSISWAVFLTPFLGLATLPATAMTPSPGCGAEGLTSGTFTMVHDGLTRTVRIHVPAGYDADDPTKLITIFHGWGGNENEFLSNDTVVSEADSRGYILAAPRGIGSGEPDRSLNSWSFPGSTTGLDGDRRNREIPGDNAGICNPLATPDYNYPSCADTAVNTCAWTHCQTDDVAFATALVGYLGEQLCVDFDNVFAAGGSNGGMFTWSLGQDPVSAPTYRAIAPIIGLPHRAYLDGPGKPGDLPVLLITGRGDTTVPPGRWRNPYYTITSDGDVFYYASATAITRVWAQAHGCSVTADAMPFDDGRPQTDCRTYCTDDTGWPRVLDCRLGMGHTYRLNQTWPLIMDFFDQQSVQ
ncbi:MAG: hypothetical protein AAF184_15065 [Pseudomonadota bacterium]